MVGCMSILGQKISGDSDNMSPGPSTRHSRRLSDIKVQSSSRLPTKSVDPSSEATLASRSRSGQASRSFRSRSFSPTKEAPRIDIRTLSAADFEARELLGYGAYGSVYLVVHKSSGQEFALKAIRKDELPSWRHYTDVFEELRITRSLHDSRWTLSLMASFHDQQYFYMLMKYYPGGSLQQQIRQRPLSGVLTTWFMAELVMALEDLHGRHIIHGDLKPDNILLDENGHVALADFGHSRAFGVADSGRPWRCQLSTKAKNVPDSIPAIGPIPDTADCVRGTPGYIAPEAWAGNMSYAADIWSLGAVFHVMCYGRLPFGMDPWMHSIDDLRVRTVYDKLELPSTVDCPASADLIRRMLDKNPLTRISLAEMKDHPNFSSTDWQLIASRPPLARSMPRRSDHCHSLDCGVLPCGDNYGPGCDPFPWFTYTSPEMQVSFRLPSTGIGKRSLSEDAPRKSEDKFDTYRQAARETVSRWMQFMTVPAARILPPEQRKMELD